MTGSAGCNNYFAEFKTSGESISIGPAGATHMFCNDPAGVMEQESLYLQALASAATFRLEGDRLTLRRADGAIALTLARESVTPDPAD